MTACEADLLDVHGNTADGIHVASCGGTWLPRVAGFGGLREFKGVVRFHPHLPASWTRLRFRGAVRGQLIEVDRTAAETTYRLPEGYGIVIQHFGEELRLVRDEPTGGGGLCAKLTPLFRWLGGRAAPGGSTQTARRTKASAIPGRHHPHQPFAAPEPAPFAASAAASRTSDLA